jgi:uncharacterized paraquat-inducible protein A
MPQEEGTPGGDLQFDHAELKSKDAQRPSCKVCNLEIGDTHFTINGHMVCPRCKDSFQAKLELQAEILIAALSALCLIPVPGIAKQAPFP